MKYKNTHPWFTLVELIVSITIFSIILVAVVSIFLFASQMSTRVELDRTMQENIKNIMEDISEGVRKNTLTWVSSWLDSKCETIEPWVWDSIKQASAVCIWDSIYTLWYENETGDGSWERSSDIVKDCQDISKVCRLVKKEMGWDYFPLSNSFIAFQDAVFTISNPELPKLTIQLVYRPAAWKWVSAAIIEQRVQSIQTTVSQKLIKTN